MTTKYFTIEMPYGAPLWMLVVGGVSTSIAAAWLAAYLAPAACDQLSFSAAFSRVPVTLNLAIFLAAVVVTSSAARRMDAALFSMAWFVVSVPVLGAAGTLIFLQLAEHLWAGFALCAGEIGYSAYELQGVVAVAHLAGWLVTLLVAAWLGANTGGTAPVDT